MPKGGAEKLGKQINTDRAAGNQRYSELQGQLQPQYNQFWQNYNQATERQNQDYGNVMGRYNEFADTGGFSPQDISNIRARSVSPLRASYAAAGRNVERQRSLQGGYSPGYGVLQGRLAREQGQGMSDATRAAEGDIAQMRQQGRLAGIGGLLSGYGATPGRSALYGNQALGGMNQILQGNQQQDQYNSSLLNAQTQQAQMPGAIQTGFNNVLRGAQVAGQLIYPWMFAGGGGGNLSSTPVGNQGFGGGYPGFAPTVPQYGPSYGR